MKTSLEHLPPEKQENLNRIKDIILEKVPAAMIILFGSYARGDWVEDYQENTEYVSDYDLLIVMGKKGELGETSHTQLEKTLYEAVRKPKPNTILHTINFLNKKLRKGSYFFVDIKEEGVMLFDSGEFKLEEPQPLDPEERQQFAKEEFEHWYNSANEFLETFVDDLKKERYSKAAFELHQATERYYAALILVFTNYKPKTHDLEELGKQANNLHPEFFTVFPCQSEEQKTNFKLLKKAYVEARYNRDYEITKAQLESLSTEVENLKTVVEKRCKEKIEELGR